MRESTAGQLEKLKLYEADEEGFCCNPFFLVTSFDCSLNFVLAKGVYQM